MGCLEISWGSLGCFGCALLSLPVSPVVLAGTLRVLCPPRAAVAADRLEPRVGRVPLAVLAAWIPVPTPLRESFQPDPCCWGRQGQGEQRFGVEGGPFSTENPPTMLLLVMPSSKRCSFLHWWKMDTRRVFGQQSAPRGAQIQVGGEGKRAGHWGCLLPAR